MKKIILEIEDSVFADLESLIVTKQICGSFYGTMDAFIVLLIKAIKDGKEAVQIIRKKPRKKKPKKKK